MRKGIHPNYTECVVTCSCGNVMKMKSTRSSMKVNVCSRCHPFFTGQQQKLLDTEGRVESFKKKYQRYNERIVKNKNN